MNIYHPATKPTIYFIGVTTSNSSIMKIFPKWAELLKLKQADIKGIDFPLHAPAEEYRKAVNFIKHDPLSLGALVTTHKIDLFNSCKDLFEYIDPFAEQLGEVSSISKKDGKFCAHAKDPISSGLALETFVPKNFWKNHDGEVLLLGAGGSSLAMSLYLTQACMKENVPKNITITNRSLPRLEEAKRILEHLNPKTAFHFVHNPTADYNDKTLRSMKPFSLIVNATGLGKDAPGSPITDLGIFPENSLVWEINYRGNLLFKHQAEIQAAEKNLHVENGWTYFIHGWTQVIAEVFHISINPEILAKLSTIAKEIYEKE